MAASAPEFLTFSSDGFIDYTREGLADHSASQPFEWEKIDWKFWANFAHRRSHYPLLISGLYIACIFILQSFMRNRKPFHLKRELALWNALLSVFSILGVTRVLPELWRTIRQPDGLHKSLCVKEDVTPTMAFWGTMFVVSKVVELGDTVFIVLRKRPLQVLQWYHHAMSLTLAWTTGPYLEPICKFYIAMNYGVHSLMYPYFAFRAMDISIPRKLANMITFLQLAQMVAGVGINIYTFWLFYFSSACHRHPFSIKMILLAYGSFVILFGELFYSLVLKKKENERKSD